MPFYSTRQCAEVLGVSDDTIRRWIDTGRLSAGRDQSSRLRIDGAELAQFVLAGGHTGDSTLGTPPVQSMRNHLMGLVTDVVRDTVMAKVEIHCGPYRLVSLISREAADELGLEVGLIAAATVKATDVSVQITARPSSAPEDHS